MQQPLARSYTSNHLPAWSGPCICTRAPAPTGFTQHPSLLQQQKKTATAAEKQADHTLSLSETGSVWGRRDPLRLELMVSVRPASAACAVSGAQITAIIVSPGTLPGFAPLGEKTFLASLSNPPRKATAKEHLSAAGFHNH